MDIICSDGSTLLSADDKAGVAEICALLKRLGDNSWSSRTLRSRLRLSLTRGHFGASLL